MIGVFGSAAGAYFMNEALRQQMEEQVRRNQHAARSTPQARASVRAQFAEFERICNDALAQPRPHANSGPFSVSQGR